MQTSSPKTTLASHNRKKKIAGKAVFPKRKHLQAPSPNNDSGGQTKCRGWSWTKKTLHMAGES